MSLQVERLEKNMARLTIEVSETEFEGALQSAYQKRRRHISIQGFRKGKAPRAVIEQLYGKDIFYEDAANEIIPKAYEDALGECDLEIVSRPEIDVEQIEKGKPFIFTAKVAVRPEVTLGEYKGLKVARQPVEVTDEEVDQEIGKVREENSRAVTVEDRAAREGDILAIDFDGYVDGKPFEGGKATDYQLTLGSHAFIDGFEEQLVGKDAGEEVEVSVTFPEDYGEKSLAGKPAVFQVVIQSIREKELPELDDEFAQDVSEFDTMEEYREDVRRELLEKKEEEEKRRREEAIVRKAVENATLEIPDAMVETEASREAEDFQRRLESQGLPMQTYLQLANVSANEFMDRTRAEARERIQTRLVLEAIVKAEGITATEEEVEKELQDMADMSHIELDKLKEAMGEQDREQVALDMAVQNAVDFIVGEAVDE